MQDILSEIIKIIDEDELQVVHSEDEALCQDLQVIMGEDEATVNLINMIRFDDLIHAGWDEATINLVA